MSNRRNTRPSGAQRRSPRRTLSTSDYKEGIQQADKILRKNNVLPLDENWQETVIEWFTTEGIERKALITYIEEHQEALDTTWAREMLRMEVFFQFDDRHMVIDHYNRVLSRYPLCAVLELWVADQISRYQGDFWCARPMYQYVQAQIPQHPKPYYELGFMNYLVGNLAGAVEQFNRAVERIGEDDDELAARIFYNRGVTRYAIEQNKEGAIADVKKALDYKPNYPQAKRLLRYLRGRSWLSW